jgi:hypothetical protein
MVMGTKIFTLVTIDLLLAAMAGKFFALVTMEG